MNIDHVITYNIAFMHKVVVAITVVTLPRLQNCYERTVSSV
jgi:hypothetical protein